MKQKYIPHFKTVNKNTHARELPDDHLPDVKNVIFEDGKVKTRWGYDEKGSNLPLTGAVTALSEFKKLRTDETTLIAMTANNAYEYDETSTEWMRKTPYYNIGTVTSSDVVGAETIFDPINSAIPYMEVAVLSSSKIAIAWVDPTVPTYEGKVIIGTVAGDVITFGSAQTFNTSTTDTLAITAVTDVKIAIAFRDSGDSYKGKVIVGTVSGTVVTFGTETEFDANNCQYITIKTVDTDKVVVAYFDSTDSEGEAVIGTISGTGISFGTHKVFNDTYSFANSIVVLSTTKIIIHHSHSYVTVGLVSDTNLTFGPSTSFTSNTLLYSNASYLDDNKLVIVYTDQTDSYYGKAIVVSVSGWSTTFGSETTWFSDTAYEPKVAYMNTDRALITFNDDNDGDKGKYLVITNSGTTLTVGSIKTFDSNDILGSVVAALNNRQVAVVYYDTVSQDGEAVVVTEGNTIISDAGTSIAWNTSWPQNTYQIKFGTDNPDGTGTPDTWYTVVEFISDDDLILDETVSQTGVIYVIRQDFSSTDTDYFDVCNTIEGLGDGDEKLAIITNGVEPVHKFTGNDFITTLGGAPNYAKYAKSYYGHLILGWCNDGTNDLPQSVYWSVRGDPEDWSGTGASYEDLINNDDRITGMEILKQRLFIFKEDSICECRYTGLVEPAFAITQDKIKDIGSPYGRTIANFGEFIIFLARDDVRVFNGFQTVPIGQPIIDDLFDNQNTTYKHKAFAIGIPQKNLYCLFIVTGTSTNPDKGYVYNYLEKSWTIWELADSVTSACLTSDDTILLGDSSGNVYEMDFSETDDDGTNIDAYFITQDFALGDYKQAFKLLETILTMEDGSGMMQISASFDSGTSWTDTIVVNQDQEELIYGHIVNWLRRGKKVRFKIENAGGSEFAFESLNIGYTDAGK